MITSKQFKKAKKKYRILYRRTYDTLEKARKLLVKANENTLASEVSHVTTKVLKVARDINPNAF